MLYEVITKTKLTDTQYSALEKVAQQFAAWRETRTKRGRIPDTLWSAAVDLFRSYGLSINKIAQTLRLNYTDLKLHITENPPVVMQPIEDESAPFVELVITSYSIHYTKLYERIIYICIPFKIFMLSC